MTRGSFRLPIIALTSIAAAASMIACSTIDLTPWKVAPNYRISNAGASAAVGYTALARQYEGERRWPEAATAWRKAAAELPRDTDILNSLGLSEARQGQFTKAISTFRRALELAPENAQLLNNLGYALLLDGQNVEAKNVLNHALILKPDYPLASANLKRAERSIGDNTPLIATSKPPETVTGPLAPSKTPSLDSIAGRGQLISIDTSPGTPNLQMQPNVSALQIQHEGVIGNAGNSAPSTTTAPPAELPAATLTHASIEIANGNGITGMATWLNGWMSAHGLRRAAYLRNQPPFDRTTTVVMYRPGYLKNAQELARRLPQRVEVAPEPGGPVDADLRVVLGHDFRSATPCQKVCPAYVASNPATASVVAAL